MGVIGEMCTCFSMTFFIAFRRRGERQGDTAPSATPPCPGGTLLMAAASGLSEPEAGASGRATAPTNQAASTPGEREPVAIATGHAPTCHFPPRPSGKVTQWGLGGCEH